MPSSEDGEQEARWPVYLVNHKRDRAWYAGRLALKESISSGMIPVRREASLSEIGEDAVVVVLREDAPTPS